jgi:hypothetical protein
LELIAAAARDTACFGEGMPVLSLRVVAPMADIEGFELHGLEVNRERID